MSEYDFEDDDFEGNDDGGENLPKPARDRLRELEKELKKLRKERDEGLKNLNELRLRDVLSERGITDKRITRYLTADGVNLADSRAIDDWLNENGDLFGYKPRSNEENQEAAASYRDIDSAEEQGTPSSVQAEILAKIANAETAEELDALRLELADLKM